MRLSIALRRSIFAQHDKFGEHLFWARTTAGAVTGRGGRLRLGADEWRARDAESAGAESIGVRGSDVRESDAGGTGSGSRFRVGNSGRDYSWCGEVGEHADSGRGGDDLGGFIIFVRTDFTIINFFSSFFCFVIIFCDGFAFIFAFTCSIPERIFFFNHCCDIRRRFGFGREDFCLDGRGWELLVGGAELWELLGARADDGVRCWLADGGRRCGAFECAGEF